MLEEHHKSKTRAVTGSAVMGVAGAREEGVGYHAGGVGALVKMGGIIGLQRASGSVLVLEWCWVEMPSMSVLDLGWKLALHVQHHRWLLPKPSCPSAELGLPELAQVLLLPGARRGQARHVPSPWARGQGQKHHSLFQERTVRLPNRSCTGCGPPRACSPGMLLLTPLGIKRGTWKY